MINMIFALTEGDKRFLFALIMAFIIVFVLIGYLGFLITRVMKWQGKKIENQVYDVVVTRVITDKKSFTKYAHKKNYRIFFNEAKIPMIIILVSLLILLIYNIIYANQYHFLYNPFDINDGFGSLLFFWDLDNPDNWTTVLGIPALKQFPQLIHTPTWNWHAWGGYLFVPGVCVGLIWYLVTVQAFIARLIHIFKLKDNIFSKNLDGFNQNQQLFNSINNQNQQNENNSNTIKKEDINNPLP